MGFHRTIYQYKGKSPDPTMKASYIIQKDPSTGEIIGTFFTTRQAERATKIDHSNISKAISGKRYKTAGGYQWERAERNTVPTRPQTQSKRTSTQNRPINF